MLKKTAQANRFTERDAMAKISKKQISDEEYWTMLRDLWFDAEEIHSRMNTWLDAFTASRADREHLSTVYENHGLAKMPKTLTIYRGANSPDVPGISWTTSRDRATSYAYRSVGVGAGDAPWITVAQVEKKHVLAYFVRGNEQEVIAHPIDVFGRKPEILR